MYDLASVLIKIRPEGKFELSGETYDGLNWIGGGAKPTLAEINDAITTYNAEEAMIRLKIERNYRLEECDWVVIRYLEAGETIHNDWKDYRDALRKLPSTTTPGFNSDGSLKDITWPTRPDDLVFADGSKISFVTHARSGFQKTTAKYRFRTGTING